MPPGEPASVERMFLALPLPPAVRDALAALPEQMHGMNWTRREQLHVTLRFLGDVAADRQEALVDRLAAIRVEPFILPIAGIGTFPPRRPPHVVWVGTGAGHPRLFQLRQRVDDAILATAIPADLRTFHPHITIARCTAQAASRLTHWLHAHRDFAAPPFRVEAFELYASVLRPGGAVHTLRHRFPLG